MECSICGSESVTTLKSKKISAKTKEINELLLKCNDCQSVFKESISESKPISIRLIISEHESSKKTSIDIYPDEKLTKGNLLLSDMGEVEITSLETKDGKRVESTITENISTIWTNSIEIPARVGVSVDLTGKVDSFKVELDRDFEFATDDFIKITAYIIRINVIKTQERKIRDGFAKARVTQRIYGKPVKFNNHDYDLTDKIVSRKGLEPKRR
ncbi:hypothetical protein ALNOE001_00860 [Candidatus Methanobinarius endosymbioticus]|uniref:Uncharacterized protein n=1 Tax=Candidatus Methanobinarius endosymbioticus TaxID=2006182 RepID=A0A366MFS7_9EURY|nr:hypothetical protein ALNOE001_00860 [Candidatus Methanobinarius endosymbioticus]